MSTRRTPPREEELPKCPFCTYHVPSHSDLDLYMLYQHVEFTHNDQESPFLARDPSPHQQRRRSRSNSGRNHHENSPSPDQDQDIYVDCPLECGEAIHIQELSDHLDLHEIEVQALEDIERGPTPKHGSRYASPRPGSSRSRTPSRDIDANIDRASHMYGGYLDVPETKLSGKHSSKSGALGGLKDFVLGPGSKMSRVFEKNKGMVKRLGKAELGPHAYEERMPAWLYKQLAQGPPIQVANTISRNGSIVRVERVENETPDIIPVLAQLSAQDPAVDKVFLCHPVTKHIFKTPKEGGFCGYRNIQMMISFMQGTQFPGHEHFPGRTPTVIRLQDLIERAWDLGFNPTGRTETGGIRGTRKYIGTPEAQALFSSLDIPCEANAFNKSRMAPSGVDVYHQVLQAVFEYFSTGIKDDPAGAKVYQTGLAPIYFQHPGHSLTICGLEIRKSGRMNLLCLDPMFKTAPGIAKLIGSKVPQMYRPEKLLSAYRRGGEYLKKYQSFEIMKLMAPMRDIRDVRAITPPSIKKRRSRSSSPAPKSQMSR